MLIIRYLVCNDRQFINFVCAIYTQVIYFDQILTHILGKSGIH